MACHSPPDEEATILLIAYTEKNAGLKPTSVNQIKTPHWAQCGQPHCNIYSVNRNDPM